jgi:asparagine synthase (glutamine-hydrolysing)
MCGINAIYNYRGITDKDFVIINEMNQQMIYRGPDSQVVKGFSEVVFGHNRLSIIGLNNGEQPLSNELDSIHLICNGEIYNHRALRKKLIALGHNFKSASDCEVIIHLYEEYGLKLFDYITGMFAFVLWDSNIKELVFARDRSGKKPIYYAKSQRGIVVSSEMKAINTVFLENSSIDREYVCSVIEYSFPTSMSASLFNEIKKVKPGHYIRCNKDLFEEIPYQYDALPNINMKIDSTKNIFQNTYDLLSEAVNQRLDAEVPVAIMLSGGIDSSAVASLATKYKNDVNAICVGYKGNYTTVDERNVARKFANEKGLIWNEIELSQKDYFDYFDEYISIIDEPIADPAAFAQWGIFKKASELGFKVLLSGIGSDEIFYGYGSHNEFGEQLTKFNALAKYFPIGHKNLYLYLINYLIKNNKKIKFHSFSDFKRQFATFKNFEVEKYGNYFNGIKQTSSELYHNFSKCDNIIENIYSFLNTSWLVNNCFHQADKLAMGCSIEVRAPFADHNLISYVNQIKFEEKYKLENPKWFLKEVLKNELPDYILKPTKKGFSPPYNFIDELVNSKKYSPFFKKKYEHFNELILDSVLQKYNIDF